jgi:hypothetical protein
MVTGDEDDENDSNPKMDYPSNVHPCPSLGAAVTADVAFVQAQKLFEQICASRSSTASTTATTPVTFMGLSSTFQRVLEERDRPQEVEDDEQAVLSSALGMLAHKEDKINDGDATDETANRDDAETDAPPIAASTTSTSAATTLMDDALSAPVSVTIDVASNVLDEDTVANSIK